MAKIEITLDTIIQKKTDVLTSDLDGEKVMMSIEKGEYYGLGKTGTFIWDNIESPIKIKALIEMITENYNIDENKCFADIAPFIMDLIEKELVVVTY